MQLQLKVKRQFINLFLMPVKPFATPLGPFKWRENPSADVSMRALIQMEGFLSPRRDSNPQSKQASGHRHLP